MKPLPRSNHISAVFAGIRLYRDDLERILALMNDAGLSTAISDDTFQYESLDDLQRTQGNSPRKLEIKGWPSIGLDSMLVSLSGRFWHIFSMGEKVDRVAREVETILRNRQSVLERTPILRIGTLGTFLIALAVFLQSYFWLFWIVLVIGLVLVFCGISFVAYPYLRAGVVLDYRHKSGFFARKRDAILLLLIGALFSGIVAYLVWRFTGKAA